MPHRRAPSPLLAALAAALCLAACEDPEEECGSFGVAEPSLASVHEVVFANSCAFSSCHGGSTPEQGLDLTTPESAHATLVGVATTTTTSARVRVDPGDPDGSYLLAKLRGEGIESNAQEPDTDAMPPPDGGICDANIEAIAAWIAAGAAAQ